MSAMRQDDPTGPAEGAQDLYPRDARLRAWLSQTIAGVVDRYGFELWDAPLLEPLSLYEAGRNLPLVENQALVFQGPRQEPLLPRAEPTPSLSRVVAGLNTHLVLPLRWVGYGHFWRNESLRLGRGREFRQWHIDVVGAPAPVTGDIGLVYDNERRNSSGKKRTLQQRDSVSNLDQTIEQEE